MTPFGRRYYAEQMDATDAVTVVESEIHRFLESADFAGRFPDAFRRWKDAEQELWSADEPPEFTDIGHRCREAMQYFASVLAQAELPDGDLPSEPAKTVDRIRAVLAERRFGDAHRAFLDALLGYWGVVNDLVMRQEHGGQKESEPLSWEDARRVVFHTAIVMFEIARSTGAAVVN